MLLVSQELATISTGEIPDFVKASEIISPSNLYKKFYSGNTRGLVCVQFLAALNVHWVMTSKFQKIQ